MSRRATPWLLAASVVLGALTAPALEAAAKPSLTIRISGLPNNERANVRVTGPSEYSRMLTRSTTLRGLQPGSYAITVKKVTLRRTRGAFRKGAIARPATERTRIRVIGKPARTVRIRYGTITNPTQLRTVPAGATVLGSASNPIALTVPGRLGLRAGTVLTSEATTALPAGLLSRVTSVSYAKGRTRLKLVPTSYMELVPQLAKVVSAPLAAQNATSPRSASRGLLRSSTGVDVSAGGFSCSGGSPVGTTRLKFGATAAPGATSVEWSVNPFDGGPRMTIFTEIKISWTSTCRHTCDAASGRSMV